MTTYRRLCCSDLLRFGSVNLQCNSVTFSMSIYMKTIASWPATCLLADTAGGRLAGYIFGSVTGVGEDTNGMVSSIGLRSMDMIDLAKKLSKMLDNCCDKIYRAYTMRFFIAYNKTEKYLADELGYFKYEEHPIVMELRKPLPLFIMLNEERILNAPIMQLKTVVER